MTQSRTHNCGELRLSNAGEQVTLVGWFENIRKVSKNLGFLILSSSIYLSSGLIK